MSSLARLTWPEVDSTTVLLIPIGSTEQHGPHLPLATDTTIATAICQKVSAILSATVAPAVPYGSSGEHQDFPGTLSVGTEALVNLLIELVRSASITWSRIVLVNAHGGNNEALTRAVGQLRAEGHDIIAWAPSWDGDSHAGRTETSLHLALAPSEVRPDRPVGSTEDLSALLPGLRAGGVRSISPTGVLGDSTDATATEGQELLHELVESCVGAVQRWQT